MTDELVFRKFPYLALPYSYVVFNGTWIKADMARDTRGIWLVHYHHHVDCQEDYANIVAVAFNSFHECKHFIVNMFTTEYNLWVSVRKGPA